MSAVLTPYDGADRPSEISGKHFDIKDTRSPRSFSKFLIRLAEMSPRLVLKQIALLQKHLDSEVRVRLSSRVADGRSRTPCATPSSR